MTIRTYTKAEQANMLTQAARAGSMRAYALMGRKRLEIEGLMLQRAMGLGLDEYGDASFHKSLDELDRESMEEAADLVMYEAIYDLRSRGYLK